MNFKRWKEGGQEMETAMKSKKEKDKGAKERRKRKTQRKRKGEKGYSPS